MFVSFCFQVKIWFQNKRSKYKKILKQQQGGGTLTPQPPGSTNLGAMSPSVGSDDDQEASVGHGSTPGPQGHVSNHPGQGHPLNNGHSDSGAGFDSPSPPQHMMTSPPGGPAGGLPQTGSLGVHSSMSPVLPPVSSHPSGLSSWSDLASSDHSGLAAHGHLPASHSMASSAAMYGGQYLPPGLPQHYGGWGAYGAPQNPMSSQPPLLT